MSYKIIQDQIVVLKIKSKQYQSCPNYATKKELDHATGADISDLVAKKDFIAWKAEVDKLQIAKLVNVPTNLNNSETKGADLDVVKLKTVSVDLKNLNNVAED